MPLETGTKISELNALWPVGSDPKSQGDDHLRLIKDVLQKDALTKEDAEAGIPELDDRYAKKSGDAFTGTVSINDDADGPDLVLGGAPDQRGVVRGARTDSSTTDPTIQFEQQDGTTIMQLFGNTETNGTVVKVPGGRSYGWTGTTSRLMSSGGDVRIYDDTNAIAFQVDVSDNRIDIFSPYNIQLYDEARIYWATTDYIRWSSGTGLQGYENSSEAFRIGNSEVRMLGVAVNTTSSNANVNATSSAGTLRRVSSSSEYKNNVTRVTALAAGEAVDRIIPVSWVSNIEGDIAEYGPDHRFFGFTLENVQEVDKDLVHDGSPDERGLLALAIAEIQALRKRVAALEVAVA